MQGRYAEACEKILAVARTLLSVFGALEVTATLLSQVASYTFVQGASSFVGRTRPACDLTPSACGTAPPGTPTKVIEGCQLFQRAYDPGSNVALVDRGGGVLCVLVASCFSSHHKPLCGRVGVWVWLMYASRYSLVVPRVFTRPDTASLLAMCSKLARVAGAIASPSNPSAAAMFNFMEFQMSEVRVRQEVLTTGAVATAAFTLHHTTDSPLTLRPSSCLRCCSLSLSLCLCDTWCRCADRHTCCASRFHWRMPGS